MAGSSGGGKPLQAGAHQQPGGAPSRLDGQAASILDTVLQHAPWGAHRYGLQPDGRLVFRGGNPAAERILGVPHAPFVGLAVEVAFPALAHTEILERYRAAARDGVAWSGDVPYDYAGLRGCFEVHAFPVGAGEMAAMFMDVTEQRQSSAVVSSERLYRTIVEQSPNGIFRSNAAGEAVFVNRRWSEITGYDAAAALGHRWLQAVHPDDRVRVAEQWQEAVRRGVDLDTEFRCQSPRGEIAWVQGKSMPIVQDGRVAGFIAVVIDITARKRAERERDRLFNESSDLFTVVGLDGRFRQINQAWHKTLGWSEAELTTRPWIELVHPYDRGRSAAALARLAAGQELQSFENRYVCRDGSYRWLSWNAVYVPEEALMFAAARDITASHEAEKHRRLVEETLQHSTDATMWVDMEGRARYANDAACRALGYSADELRALHVWDIDAHLSPEHWRQQADQVKRLGSLRIESEHRRRDGALIPVELSIHHFEFEGEERIVGIARDITARKREERERAEMLEREQQARAAADEANRAKDRFLAVLSHELRTPLTPILAGVELLRAQVAANERASRVVDVIQRNTRHEARLLDDLLDLSRVVRGKIALHRAPLRLESVVRDAVQSQQAQASDAGVRLVVAVTADLWVMADAHRLQQICLNLLTNALKFTPKGGVVAVSTERVDGRARLGVTDSGCGIDPKRLPTLFETMFQQQEGGVQRRPGLGVGLALVKSLTAMHGGRVAAESEGPGRGSRFIVELPLIMPPIREAQPALAAAPRRPRPRDVLLVEDNPDTRLILAETLAGLDYRVSTAASAEEALEQLAREREYVPDIILADIGLPGIDGYEFLREARRMPRLRRTPAFAITGYGQPKDVDRAREAGFVEHFVKPVDVPLLHERIAEYPPRA